MATETKDLRERILSWEGCLNARDLGGYPTEDGRETLWGAVFRCDNPAQLTAEGEAAALAHDVRTVIDLRKPDEVEAYPNPFRLRAGSVDYVNISLVDPAVEHKAFTTLAENYIWTLEEFSEQVASVMHVVATARPGAVLINCVGGKDRTGLICALLLDLCTVPTFIIAEDYALSSQCLWPRDDEWLRTGPGTREERQREFEKVRARDDVMLEVFRYLHDRYGGVESYLRKAGVSALDLTLIRERLLGP